MKITIKEAMKKISFLEQRINNLLQDERQNSYVEYINEADKELPSYNMEEVSQELESLQEEILKLRKAINKANQETLIGIENLTISDALIKLAQLNKNAQRFEELASYKQKARRASLGENLEWIERIYDVKEAQSQHLQILEKIYALQTALDKANILTEVEL